MKKILSIIIVGLGLIFINSSCTNLDEEVYSKIPMDGFIANEEALLMYAGRAYTKLQKYPEEQQLWSLTENASDELVIPARDNGEWDEQGRWRQIQTHQIDPSNKILRQSWEFVFGGITACNEIIQETEESSINFEGKDKILAEIKILRAFFYYWAMDAWGNIPFTTDFRDKSEPMQKDRAFIFSFIEQEIKDNIEYLEDIPTTKNYGRVTQGMANMLLAKLYMNSKEWTGTERWQDAIDACDKIISTGNYQIEDDFFTNFKVENQKSKENIFVIPYDKILTKERFYWYTLSLSDDSRTTFDFKGNMWDGFVCQPDFFKKFDEADKRRDSFLYGQQYDKQGSPIIINGESFIYTPEIAVYTSRKKWEGARICKYEYQTDLLFDETDMENDFVLFRYADVLYTKMEALWRKNGVVGSFLNDTQLQKIRTRAGMPVYTEADITSQELLDELGREFAWEGHRRQDLIRFGVWGKAWWSKPATDANKKLFPIPQTALETNSNLTQNPL